MSKARLFAGSVILYITSLEEGELPGYSFAQACPPVQPLPGAMMLLWVSRYGSDGGRWNLQLVGTLSTDGINSSLVVGEDELRVHVMGLQGVSNRVLGKDIGFGCHTSFMRPNMTFSLSLNRLASSPQKAAN